MSTITNSLNNDSNFLTAATGMTATTGDITASTGDIVASVGNLVATDGNLVLTSGLIALGGSFGTTGNVLTSQGNVTAPIWAPAAGGGMTWTNVGAGAQQIAKGNFYSCNGAVILTLPTLANSTEGDTFAVLANPSYGGTFRINCDATKNIVIGTATATITTGHIDSTANGDVVYFVCSFTDSATAATWTATSVIGNITVV